MRTILRSATLSPQFLQSRLRMATSAVVLVTLVACGTAPAPIGPSEKAHLPLLRGWFEGQEVLYVTTDVSDADVARAKHANYAPLLANALPDPQGSIPSGTRRLGATDRVYGTTNFEQASVFASAPRPVGPANAYTAYSPLWQLVEVTWVDTTQARSLRSEEEVLDAQDKGQITLQVTRVVLNCPIIHRGRLGALPGVSVDGRMP
jgi:hypothetical protein